MSAHRYWRLRLYGSCGGAVISFSEVQLRESEGGSDVTGSGTASASSSYDGSTLPANAFDNDIDTRWSSTNSALNTQWLKYDFGAGQEKSIIEVVITSRNDTSWALDSPSMFDLQYSDDDSNWFILFSVIGASTWAQAESKTFSLSSAIGVGISPHIMTANSTPSPYVASASSSSEQPYKAFNGGITGGDVWASNASDTGWIQIDLGVGNATRIYKYSVQVDNWPNPNRAPKDWILKGSNDELSWDNLDSRSNQTAWGSGETRTFTLSDLSASYRYYRLDISDNNGDTYLQLAEFTLFGPLGLGTVCWGHDTGVTESSIRNLSGNWSGSGYISGVGDAERINFVAAENEESETWNIGARRIKIQYNKYSAGSGIPTIKYKNGSSQALCEADTWHNYVGSFVCSGWVKVRIET